MSRSERSGDDQSFDSGEMSDECPSECADHTNLSDPITTDQGADHSLTVNQAVEPPSSSPVNPSSTPFQIKGVLWIVLAGFLFSGMAALVKFLAEHTPAVQLIFIRMGVQVLILLPLLAGGLASLSTKSIKLHAVRVALGLVAITAGIYSIILLPLADATAISFTRSLFVTILAIYFLNETVGIRRWCAVIVGFAGVLVMLRPGTQSIDIGALLALASACAAGGVTIAVKRLTASEATITMLAFPALAITIAMAIPTALVWVTPNWTDAFLLLAMACLGLGGQWCMINGFRLGDATLLAPVDYLRIVFAALFGYWLFGHVPTIWTALGALIIVGSTIYLMRREAILARTRPIAPETHH